jgi:DNA-binding NarL/FixJ family response regulator
VADVEFERGDVRRAAALAEESVALARAEHVSSWWLVQGLLTRAKVAALQRDAPRAAALTVEALSLSREIGNRAALARALEVVAHLAVLRGESRRAALLSAAATRVRDMLGGALLPASARLRRMLEVALSTSMSVEARRGAAREAQALDVDASIDFALRALEPEAAAVPRGPLDVLTPREREVACLVAQGLTNRQVAERLVLTEKTAANHLGRAFEKLGVASRSQLAARAHELGLSPGTETG